MKKGRRSMLVLGFVTAFIGTVLFLPGLARTDYQKPYGPPPVGVVDKCNSNRFKCVMGGAAVLDKETGLTWARDANIDGKKKWIGAIRYCANLVIGDRKGWRIPKRDELASLLDMSSYYLAPNKLPFGHPFQNVQSEPTDYYWCSTVWEGQSGTAWRVNMFNGAVDFYFKEGWFYMWSVR